jgi:hypothetical protein
MDVFKHFSCHTKLPIRLPDVEEHVMEAAAITSITTYPADLDLIDGFVWHYKWRAPYGDQLEHALVFYKRTLTLGEQRIVRCKEVLHLLDGDEETSRTRDRVNDLIADMCLPFNIPASTLQGQKDRMGILPALTVLLPRDALEILRPLYQSGAMTAAAIAEIAQIPEEWAELCLGDEWRHVVENLDDGK